MISSLYFGRVMHKRLRPFRHRFNYRVVSLWLDLDELREVAGGLRLLSHNRFNLFAFFDRDHGTRDGRPLRPWLIRIAHNLASNYHRDRARRPETNLEAVEPPSHPHGTEQIVEGREELRTVMDRLERLSDDRREALIMRFALGMSNREIARALGRTDGATKVLIHRAIKQLEEEMSGT